MKNIFLSLCISIITGFGSSICAQVQKGDMLFGVFSDINGKTDGQKYVGEVISVESDVEFTLRFSHSGSIYHFGKNPDYPAYLAKVMSSKGGKYNSDNFFFYQIFRPMGLEEEGTTVFWNIKFPDGKSFPSIVKDEMTNEKYFAVEMLHSGNIYKMGYNFRVYETGKGFYKAGTPFEFIPLRPVNNSDKTSIQALTPNPIPDGNLLENLKKNSKKNYEKAKKQYHEILRIIIEAIENTDLRQFSE